MVSNPTPRQVTLPAELASTIVFADLSPDLPYPPPFRFPFHLGGPSNRYYPWVGGWLPLPPKGG